MHVLALLFAPIAMLAVAPGDARCAEECEARCGEGLHNDAGYARRYVP